MDWEVMIRPAGRDDGAIAIDCPPDLYACPLTFGLDSLPGLQVRRNRLNDVLHRFAAGESACALLPILHVPAHRQARLIPGLGVFAAGHTGSERLLCRVPPEEIRGMAIGAGASQELLARALIGEVYGRVPVPVEAPVEADAVLVGGDAGLRAKSDEWVADLDLGALWAEVTEKPLPLAVWATGFRAPLPRLRTVLAKAAQDGAENVEALADEVTERLAGESKKYIGGLLYYRMGSAEMEGIRLLVELGAKHDLCPEQTRLRFS